ncbi:MAG TPA: acyl carrier protein [Jatrophihabitans sp.]|jgi:acyl carrier protein|uniref:acyl carrier protein n=1 Tax=Jatrophihabitans sp. TaxID=1932789 RepID=UPI002F14D558
MMHTDTLSAAVASTASPIDVELVRYADSLDCMQANLAVLADVAHGSATELRLGRRLHLRHRRGAGGLNTVEPTLAEQLADARDHLGLQVAHAQAGLTAGELLGDLADGQPRFVVADAFDLAWTPYAGQRHMSHSFLVRRHPDGVELADAYVNDTPWGQARPARWVVAAEQFAELPARLEHALVLVAVPLEPEVDQVELTEQAIEDYLTGLEAAAGTPAGLDALVLEAWLLSRARRLRAHWLAGRPGHDPAAIERHLQSWKLVCERIYLAQRRAERGSTVPAGVFGMFASQVRADLAVLATTPPGAADARQAVDPAAANTLPALDADHQALLDVIATVLKIPAGDCAAASSLTELPGYSSLRLVQLVEALESSFGIEFAAEDLDPVQLHDIGFLRRLLARQAPGPGSRTAEQAS